MARKGSGFAGRVHAAEAGNKSRVTPLDNPVALGERQQRASAKFRVFPLKKRGSLFTEEISLSYNVFVGESDFADIYYAKSRFHQSSLSARTNKVQAMFVLGAFSI
ncbi:MAG TPA: hypothetical protein VN512_01155 [Clostridia bacterium]|nr:hypothetical protein [Clostridia bacterium]